MIAAVKTNVNCAQKWPLLSAADTSIFTVKAPAQQSDWLCMCHVMPIVVGTQQPSDIRFIYTYLLVKGIDDFVTFYRDNAYNECKMTTVRNLVLRY